MAKQSRKQTKRNRGGAFTLAALGKAAADVLIPASFFYALKKRQTKSLRKMYR